MANALPWVVGAIGALSSQDQNRRANRQASEGMDLQREQAQREREIYDILMGKLEEAEGAGVWDAEKQIADLDKEFAAYEARDAGNTAGAMRIMGYKPGDSETINRTDAIKGKYRLERDSMASNIRRQLPLSRLQAYASLKAPNLAGIGANMTAYGQSQRSDPTAMFGSIMPYLMPQGQQPRNQSWSQLEAYNPSLANTVKGLQRVRF